MGQEFARELQREVAAQLHSHSVFAKQQEQLIAGGSNMDQSFYPSQNLENSKMNLDDLQSFGGKENLQGHINNLQQSRITVRSFSQSQMHNLPRRNNLVTSQGPLLVSEHLPLQVQSKPLSRLERMKQSMLQVRSRSRLSGSKEPEQSTILDQPGSELILSASFT